MNELQSLNKFLTTHQYSPPQPISMTKFSAGKKVLTGKMQMQKKNKKLRGNKRGTGMYYNTQYMRRNRSAEKLRNRKGPRRKTFQGRNWSPKARKLWQMYGSGKGIMPSRKYLRSGFEGFSSKLPRELQLAAQKLRTKEYYDPDEGKYKHPGSQHLLQVL